MYENFKVLCSQHLIRAETGEPHSAKNQCTVSYAKSVQTDILLRSYNRLLSLTEFLYNITCAMVHISGPDNVLADAGSRA
ncbi:hypothetical protein PHMEG_0006625 [Phytophthora megakarya]|uniref:Uncharacterized protein n=1 Tax=Phytophthora megakarya TaxID=4795 RepID=A0A225WNF1_9STRA|nr:hypothetical protein PHMEG_0006625 [Phytophthora megakarya]